MSRRYPLPTWEIPASGCAHLLGFAVVVLTRCAPAHEPLFKPEEVMIVSMEGPPAELSRMPQKAERAPELSRGSESAPTPPPPNPNDMAFQSADAQAAKGDPNADRVRKELMDQLRREQMLRDLTAPEGSTDRLRTGTDGGEGSVATAGVNDPELARWQKKAQQLVAANWHPLAGICSGNPRLTVRVRVEVAAGGGAGEDPEVVAGSGNVSLDESGRRAVEATRDLPPLPEKYSGGISATFEFACKDIR